MGSDRRRGRLVRTCAAGRLARRLRALQPRRAAHGRGRGQARERPAARCAGPGHPLRGAARRPLRVPLERRGGALPGPRPGRPRPRDRDLLLPGRSGTPDRRAGGTARAGRRPDRPQDRGSRLPDRLHRGALGAGGAGAAQAPGGDGDGDRQDPYRGGLRQTPVRGRRDHPRPLPGGPDRAGRTGRGRLHRSSPRLPLPRAAPGPRLRPRQAHHHRHLADHDRRVPRALLRLFRPGDHRRMPPLDLRQMERRAAAFRRHPVGPDRDPLHRGRRRAARPRGRALRARHATLLRARRADLPLRAAAGDRRRLAGALPHLPGDDREDRGRGRLRGRTRRARLVFDGRSHAGGAR